MLPASSGEGPGYLGEPDCVLSNDGEKSLAKFPKESNAIAKAIGSSDLSVNAGW